MSDRKFPLFSKVTRLHRDLDPVLQSLRGSSFLSTGDLTSAQMKALIDLAVAQKQGAVTYGTPMSGKTMALLFFNPSLRTRVSMSVAVTQLGGTPVVLDVGKGIWDLEHRLGVVMDGNKPEHIKDALPLLSEYVDAIGVRCFPFLESWQEDVSEPVLSAFREYSKVPVINLESAMHHPCQAMADMLTIREAFGVKSKRKVVLHWTWHPKALPFAVGNSFALAAAQCGMDLTVCAPPEFALDDDFMADVTQVATDNAGSVSFTSDRSKATDGAHIIYAKSWMSRSCYGDRAADLELRNKYRNWIVNDDTMALTDGGKFMHCLPVRRNVEVTDGVIDGPHSLTQAEAANRLHMQKTLLSVLMR